MVEKDPPSTKYIFQAGEYDFDMKVVEMYEEGRPKDGFRNDGRAKRGTMTHTEILSAKK